MTLVELRRLIRVFADSMYQYRVSQSIGHLVCSMKISDPLDPLQIDVDWFPENNFSLMCHIIYL